MEGLFDIPLKIWFRYREIETVEGTVEIKDVFRDDARSLYEMLSMLNSNDGDYKGKFRTISRVLDKSREIYFDSEDVELEGKQTVGVIKLNVDELEIIEHLIDKPPEKAVVAGHTTTTIMMFDTYIKHYKGEFPELFGKDKKDDEDADDSALESASSEKNGESATKHRIKKQATKSKEVEDESKERGSRSEVGDGESRMEESR